MPDLGAGALGVGLLVVAAAVLVAGADLFVDNLAAAAARLRLSVVAAAVLLAGAEPEEALTSALASARDRPGLAVGDALGANITVLTLVLGLAAVVAPVPVGRTVRRLALAASGAGVVAVLVLADGRVSRVEGGGLLATYAVVVGLLWWRDGGPPPIGDLASEEPPATGHRSSDASGALAKAFGGLALMTAGGVAAVAGAERVVAGSGLDDTAVGLTVLALATSAEMLALVVASRRRALAEVAVAAAVGAAVYNATVSLAAAALVRPLRVEGVIGPAVLAAALPMVVVLLARGGQLRRVGGGVLLLGYVGAVLAATATAR